MPRRNKVLFPVLQKVAEQLEGEFEQIPSARREVLKQLSNYVQDKATSKQNIYLNFICTHNSRRSHISQLWAQAAAYYYGVEDVVCLSGGTEATAFNPRAVGAMQNVGFNISKIEEGNNPVYEVRYSEDAAPLIAFSKTYNDPFNHNDNYAAIMTCSHADTNCPMVLGATKRISITYEDPKEFDGTSQETIKYAERVHQIGREILFVFSQVIDN